MSDLKERVADLVRFNKDPLAIAEEAIALIRADTLEEAADRIAQLEAALREIDQARYTGRCTINPVNGYDQAVALNKKLVGVMNIARAALEASDE